MFAVLAARTACGNVRPITVDYSLSLAEMIAAGNYGYVNPNVVAANFLLTGSGAVDTKVILVHFNRYIGSDEVIAELSKSDLAPASIEHATAFAVQHPDVLRVFPIVFLGSVWASPDGRRRIPYIRDWGGGRGLGLGDWNVGWFRRYRFAGVHKVQPAHRP